MRGSARDAWEPKHPGTIVEEVAAAPSRARRGSASGRNRRGSKSGGGGGSGAGSGSAAADGSAGAKRGRGRLSIVNLQDGTMYKEAPTPSASSRRRSSFEGVLPTRYGPGQGAGGGPGGGGGGGGEDGGEPSLIPLAGAAFDSPPERTARERQSDALRKQSVMVVLPLTRDVQVAGEVPLGKFNTRVERRRDSRNGNLWATPLAEGEEGAGEEDDDDDDEVPLPNELDGEDGMGGGGADDDDLLADAMGGDVHGKHGAKRLSVMLAGGGGGRKGSRAGHPPKGAEMSRQQRYKQSIAAGAESRRRKKHHLKSGGHHGHDHDHDGHGDSASADIEEPDGGTSGKAGSRGRRGRVSQG